MHETDGEGGLDRSRVTFWNLNRGEGGRKINSSSHLSGSTQNLKRSQQKFDHSLSNIPHTDRITWCITQTFIQIEDSSFFFFFKTQKHLRQTYLADNYNSGSNTNFRASKGYNHVWREPLLFLGFRGRMKTYL